MGHAKEKLVFWSSPLWGLSSAASVAALYMPSKFASSATHRLLPRHKTSWAWFH